MIIPAYFQNGLPSWDGGVENTLQPYHLQAMDYDDEDGLQITNSQGREWALDPKHFNDFLRHSHNGVVMARLGFTSLLLTAPTIRPLTPPPIGGKGDLHLMGNRFTINCGPCTVVDFLNNTCEKAILYHDRHKSLTDAGQAVGRGEDMSLTVPTGVQHIAEWKFGFCGDVADWRLCDGDLPYTGVIYGRATSCIQHWRDGKIVHTEVIPHHPLTRIAQLTVVLVGTEGVHSHPIFVSVI